MLVLLLTTEVAILPLGRAAEWDGQHRDSLRQLQARAGQHSDLHQDDFEEGCHLHSRSGSYHTLHSSSSIINRFSLRLILWGHELDAIVSQR